MYENSGKIMHPISVEENQLQRKKNQNE